MCFRKKIDTGEAIQYLMDNGLDVASIFSDGYFIVK